MNIDPAQLLDLLSLLFILSLVFAAVIMGGKNLRKSAAFIRETCIPMGIIGTLIGTVLMLQDLSDPTAIGPAFSVGLLTMLYGFILFSLLPSSQNPVMNADNDKNALPTHNWLPDIIGLGVLFVAIFSAMASNGKPQIFFDVVAFTCVVLFTIVPTLLYSDPEHNLLEGKLIAARNYATTTTAISIIVGIAGGLANIEDPSAYGPYIAIALLGSIYCGIIIITSTLLYRSVTDSQIPDFLSYTISYVMAGIVAFLFFGMTVTLAFS